MRLWEPAQRMVVSTLAESRRKYLPGHDGLNGNKYRTKREEGKSYESVSTPGSGKAEMET